MTKINYQALREAAEKAGEDKWQAKKVNGDFFVIRHGSYTRQHGYTSYQPIAEIDCKPVRDFVAKANPATVLALLDELEAAEKQIAESESLMVPQLPQPAVTHDAATAIRACLDEFPEGVRDIVEECAAIAENACCADKPAPVSVPAAMEIDDDFDSAFEHGKAVGWNAYRAAMLQGAEPVTTAYRLPFEQWLSQQTGTIDVECGCVMTEVFFHWMRVAYEAGNSPVAPDCSANILRRWLAFGRAMQSSGSQLPRHLIAETESMLAAAPQQEVK